MTQRNSVYKTKTWARLREYVLKYDKYICQRCAGNYKPDPTLPKRLTKATLVHHNFEAEKYPEWKYKMFVTIDGKRERNLYSLCPACHEWVHRDTHRNEDQKKKKWYRSTGFTTVERWD